MRFKFYTHSNINEGRYYLTFMRLEIGCENVSSLICNAELDLLQNMSHVYKFPHAGDGGTIRNDLKFNQPLAFELRKKICQISKH